MTIRIAAVIVVVTTLGMALVAATAANAITIIAIVMARARRRPSRGCEDCALARSREPQGLLRIGYDISARSEAKHKSANLSDVFVSYLKVLKVIEK